MRLDTTNFAVLLFAWIRSATVIVEILCESFSSGSAEYVAWYSTQADIRAADVRLASKKLFL